MAATNPLMQPNVQSIPTSQHVVKDRTEPTLREPEAPVEAPAEAPIEAPVEGQEGVDPVADNVVEEKAADQEAEQQVARHQVQGDIGAEERAALKAQGEEIETARMTRIAGLEAEIAEFNKGIESGDLSSTEGNVSIQARLRAISQAEAEATRALLPIEARLAAADMQADSRMKADRSKVMADPVFQSLQQDGRMDAMLSDPNADSPFFPGVSNASLGLQNPAFIAAAEKYATMKAERDAAMQEIEALKEKDNQRLSTQHPALNKIATGGSPPTGVTPPTSKPASVQDSMLAAMQRARGQAA